MRSNPLKKKIQAGEAVFGTMAFEFFVPGLPQMVKACGAEFLLYDMEHSGVDYETIKEQFALCRGIGLVPLVRVPANQYQFISRALDIGAMGIMVPMVGTAEEAQFMVSCTQYPPHGRRGAAFGFAHDDYEGGDIVEKMRVANERVLVMPLIETAEGIKNVDKIAAVPGVDMLFLGHFDLSNFLGVPGQFEHPKYTKAVDALVAAGRKHGKPLACMASTEAWAQKYWDLGFRIFSASLDSHLLQAALRDNLGILERVKNSRSAKAAKKSSKKKK